jgi:hypothetical protein
LATLLETHLGRGSSRTSGRTSRSASKANPQMMLLIDPRLGDVEDDASSTKRRSLLAIGGSLLSEISIPKLIASWLLLLALPAMVLGLAPLVSSGWVSVLSRKVTTPPSGVWVVALIVVIAALGWLGGRRILRTAEQSFWSLNALAAQPGYALCREGLRHLSERLLEPRVGTANRARIRAGVAAAAGVIVSAAALCVVALAWRGSRWIGDVADLSQPLSLALPAFANALVLVGAYLAGFALIWGIADARMDQPRDLASFDPAPPEGRLWRVAHLSDLHVVGERFGFRIESGRSGPCGNAQLVRLLSRLEVIHKAEPVDLVLITGDVTDAGRSSEWAEFLSAIAKHQSLAKRTLLLPGNHDLNVVDRANPARLDLPTSPGKRLRQLRALSAIAALQGDKVRLIDPRTGGLGRTLREALAPHLADIAAFADRGTLRLSIRLAQVFDDVFPMVLPPDGDDGLGVILLNSNSESHFSFTNALGLIAVEQARALLAIARGLPRARWIIALHHHLIEYPKPAKFFSERIGTALINGTWFVRELQSLGSKVVVMHGHRHIDWIGECGPLRIISAPSAVMTSGPDGTDRSGHFHIHTLGLGEDGSLCLLRPERVDIASAQEEAQRSASTWPNRPQFGKGAEEIGQPGH